MALPRDPETGRFMSKKYDGVAVYASTGPGTCNIKNLILTMEPARMGETSGKTIEFKNGMYKTSDPKEIEFLDWKEKHPKPFSAIKRIQKLDKEEAS